MPLNGKSINALQQLVLSISQASSSSVSDCDVFFFFLMWPYRSVCSEVYHLPAAEVFEVYALRAGGQTWRLLTCGC